MVLSNELGFSSGSNPFRTRTGPLKLVLPRSGLRFRESEEPDHGHTNALVRDSKYFSDLVHFPALLKQLQGTLLHARAYATINHDLETRRASREDADYF